MRKLKENIKISTKSKGSRKKIQCTHCQEIYYFYGRMCKCKCPKCKGRGHKLLEVKGKQEF